MYKYIKKYWFGFLITVFVSFYLMVMSFVLLSPKQDNLNRGFIPCTQEMSQQILANKKQNPFTLAKIVINNTYCDTKVVLSGFANWIKGTQKTPWENYFFTPETNTTKQEKDEALEMYYKENPDYAKEMQELHEKRLALEESIIKQNEEEKNKTIKPFEIDVFEKENKEIKDEK